MGVFDGLLSFFGFGPSEAPAKAEAPRARAAAPRSRRASDISEIVTLEPKSYADAVEVAANFRLGIPVIVNIGNLSEAEAKQMRDFMLGLKEGLEGHIRRVTPKVFLLSPSHVAVTDTEAEEEEPDN